MGKPGMLAKSKVRGSAGSWFEGSFENVGNKQLEFYQEGAGNNWTVPVGKRSKQPILWDILDLYKHSINIK